MAYKFSTAEQQSAILGAAPGNVAGVGQLPYSWRLDAQGLHVEVLRSEPDTWGRDFVDVRVSGKWVSQPPGLFSIALGQPSAWPASQGDTIRQRVMLARAAVSRQGVIFGVFGIDSYLAGAVNGPVRWEAVQIELPMGRMRPFMADWTFPGANDAVTPRVGFNFEIGKPIDVTVRVGWNDCRKVT